MTGKQKEIVNNFEQILLDIKGEMKHDKDFEEEFSTVMERGLIDDICFCLRFF